MQEVSQLTEIHARRDGTLSDTISAIHVVGSVLKLTVPVNSSAVL